MRPYLAELARIADCYVSCYPNAGLPNAFGAVRRAAAGHRRATCASSPTSGFVNIVGGCCGTTPDHIRGHRRGRSTACRRAEFTIRRLDRREFRRHPSRRARGADDPPRQQLPDDRRADQRHRLGALRAARQGRATTPRPSQVALDQVRGGANLIDVNMDEGMLDSEQAMTEFLNYIATEPEIARVPIMIDSSKWSVIEAGLKCVQGKPVVNSISLKEGEDEFLRKAAARPPLRRRRRRDGVRRAGAGRHDRAEGRDLPARVRAADRARRLRSAPTSSSTRTSSRSRPASRSTTSTPSTSSRRRGSSRRRARA